MNPFLTIAKRVQICSKEQNNDIQVGAYRDCSSRVFCFTVLRKGTYLKQFSTVRQQCLNALA